MVLSQCRCDKFYWAVIDGVLTRDFIVTGDRSSVLIPILPVHQNLLTWLRARRAGRIGTWLRARRAGRIGTGIPARHL